MISTKSVRCDSLTSTPTEAILNKNLKEMSLKENSSHSDSSSFHSGALERDQPKKLHESVFQKFDKTKNGKMYMRNLNSIFSILLINLKLTADTESSGKSSFRLFSVKKYPYSFNIEDAITHMKQLELSVNHPATNTTFSYSIKPDLAFSLIKKLMKAKLLHTPADRTRLEPKNGIALQPTPKGCAILQNFCQKNGLKGEDIPPILFSNFNSMNLICFERHASTDNIIYSEYLIHLIFTKFIGPSPNVWGSTNEPDPIPDMITKLSYPYSFLPNLDFDFDDMNVKDSRLTKSSKLSSKSKKEQNLISPFYHKFFTNPESDSHVQYYSSCNGVRLFGSKMFGDEHKTIEYSFTGKAAVQWFMDCTDALNHSEAAELVSLLLKYNLIKPITLPPSTSRKDGFSSGYSCFYTLTEKGFELSQWGKTDKKELEDLYDNNAMYLITSKDLTLRDVLEDPGSRFLFRRHLEDNLCVENLDVYIEILHFIDQMALLMKFLRVHKSHQQELKSMPDLPPPYSSTKESKKNSKPSKLQHSDQLISKLINECLSKAYSIYSSYLSYGTPYQINISDDWRRQAQKILIHSQSPFQEVFPLTPTLPTSSSFENETLTKSNSSEKVAERGSPKETLDPTESALQILEQIYPLFQKVNKHIFFLLSQDSFPKFINSEIFNESNNQIKLRPARSQSVAC